MDWMQVLNTAAETIRKVVGTAEIGVILGSGLGEYAEALEDASFIDYADIAATCAEWLGLPERFGATSFANELR